jgi:hypothetical protein
MRRTRMLVAGAAIALSSLTAGTGVALAQTEDPELREQCRSYDLIEWLLFHHECHGHTSGVVYWPW